MIEEVDEWKLEEDTKKAHIYKGKEQMLEQNILKFW